MPIPDWLHDNLVTYWQAHSIGELAPIFPITRQAVWNALKIRGIEPHDLRRYGAYLLMEEGKNLKTIQASLRHASASTTEKYLRDMSPTALHEQLSDSKTWERRIG